MDGNARPVPLLLDRTEMALRPNIYSVVKVPAHAEAMMRSQRDFVIDPGEL